MYLFVDIEGVLVQKCFRKEKNQSIRHILLNIKNFEWIKSQNFEKIFVVSYQKGIDKGWLDDEQFCLELQYVSRSLELFTKTNVFSIYSSEISNGYLIKEALEKYKIDKCNAVILAGTKQHKKDAAICGLRYIDAKSF